MVIEKYNSNFHATYDELTQEVQLAMAALVPERLQEWFSHLDGEPEAAREVARLESSKNFSQWLATQGLRPHPGAPRFDWPANNEDRLGMHLLLFRSMARGDINAAVLGKTYLPGSGQNINDAARAFITQYFRPMTKELLRHLRRVGQQPGEKEVPAADRVVRLDHNSAAYHEAMAALERLEEILRGANNYPDPEEKEQVIGEVSATRRLFQSARVRIGAVIGVLTAPTLYLVKQFAGTAIGDAAQKVIDVVALLLGHIF